MERGSVAPNQPSMVTFAFTDIEGSTARWERDRVAMQDAVRRHDTILRGAIAAHGGSVFKAMGDAFFSVFTTPEDAVAAMLTAQQALAAEDFSAIDGLRVRVAIHTGTADERDGDYFGSDVNRVSRLLAIGHGGQILLTAEASSDFARCARDDRAGVALRDLGAYHLKDFAEPQRVHQLLAPGLPAEFPPLRSVGTLPSDISIVDTAAFHPVPGFSGRDEELATVHAALQHDGAIAVVYGLGGVGKSSVAREYGWRNRDRYSVTWWLGAQTEDGIIDGLLRLGAMFVQGLDQLADRRAAAQRVVNSVLGGFDKPVLLVFDNLEDEALLRTWLPRTALALATSRNTAWSGDIVAIPLDVWDVDTAVGYLQRESGRADFNDADASAIARSLGALPLALSHAAAALRNLRMVSPQRYLERIGEHLKNAPRGAYYPRSVFATFSTAIAHAEQQAPGAAAVLCFAAAFAPDAIPDELFRQPIDSYTGDMRLVLAGDLRLDEALGALDRLSLLSFALRSQSYGMHRLVQLAARDLVGSASREWSKCAVAVADAAFPKVEFETWPQCGRLLPHARAALDTLPNEMVFLPAADLAHRCAVYLSWRGEYSVAEPLFKRALAIKEKTLGPEHPDAARSLMNLASVCFEQGRYDEAEPLHKRALTIWEKALGPEHPDVASSLNNLAIVYEEQGRYDQAQPLLQRALAIKEKALGPEHPDVATNLNNLALVYWEQERYDAAEPLHERALAIREKTLGPDHPDVASSLNGLANVYLEQGRCEAAEPLHERALAIWEKALGPEHPEVAHSLHGLANVYHEQGRYEEAEPLHKRGLAIREKALGLDHPLVATVLSDLARLHESQERHKDAELLYVRALAIREKALGLENTRTKAVRGKLENLRSK